MNPILYERDEIGFANNGLVRLIDCKDCKCTEEKNGIFECDFEYPVDGENFDMIQCGRIIGVTHDDTGDIQPFDIVSYTKPIDGIVTFHAVHISYRLGGIVCRAQNIKGASNAMQAIVETAQPSIGNFHISTEIGNTTSYVAAFDGSPRSARQLLGGVEGSILDTFGGEYLFDRWDVTLKASRGSKKDFAIRYGVNLSNYNEDTDYLESYNACIPFWKGNDNGTEVIQYGAMVNSGQAAYSGRTICAALDLSDKFEDKPTVSQLETLAQSLMRSRQTWLPSQTIKVDFVRLQDFAEFSQYRNLYDCSLGDSIDVLFPRYGMSGTYKIVKIVWDVLEGRYSEMELGALSTSLADALGITNSLGGTSSGASGDDFSVRGDLAVGGDASVVGSLTVAGSTIKDVVIETGGSGVNTHWYYRKWASGTLECWCRKEYSGVAITSTFGSVRYASLANFSDYPVAFRYFPVTTVTGSITNGNGWVVQDDATKSTTNVGKLTVYAPSNISSAKVTVNVYSIGRWKS